MRILVPVEEGQRARAAERDPLLESRRRHLFVMAFCRSPRFFLSLFLSLSTSALGARERGKRKGEDEALSYLGKSWGFEFEVREKEKSLS